MMSPARTARASLLAVAAFAVTACLPAEGGTESGESRLDQATRVMGADGRAVAEAAGFRTEEITTGVDSKTCESGGANRFDAERTATPRENAEKEHEAIFKAAKQALRERGYRSEGDNHAFRPGAAGGMDTSEWRKDKARVAFVVRRADGGTSPDGKTYKPTISLRGTTDCLS